MRNPAKSGEASAGGGTVAIEMPRLSTEEGTAMLSAWLVAVGDRVAKGDLVAELETDKATVELEAPVDGQIEALVVKAGSEGLKPGVLLGRITPTAAVALATSSAEAGTDSSARAHEPAGEIAGASAPPTVDAVRSAATPLARRLAESEGIDLGRVTGTGVGGRIEKADVERSASPAIAPAATAATPAAAATIATAATAATIANAAVAPVAPAVLGAVARASRAPRPGVQLAVRCRVDGIVAARARLNAGLAPGASRGAGGDAEAQAGRITLNDFVVRAAAQSLRDLPAANHRRVGETSEKAEAVDIAIVAAGEAGPRIFVVRDADRKGLAVLSEEIRSLGAGAREAKSGAGAESAASLLVTSFARFGIESAHPMLPAEQLCVLAVGAVVEEPVVRDGAVAVGSNLNLTLVFDPTALGGAVGAELLAAIRMRLEDPLGMVL